MTSGLQYEPMQLKRTVINRWLTSGIFETKMKFVPMTMEGNINDWLIKGFSIHENPCRKEFVTNRRSHVPDKIDIERALPGSTLALRGEEKPWEVYFPWGNPRVEWSGFWFVPTHLCTYAVTGVVASSAHQAKLILRTCGGLTLWLNGSLVTDFAPFTRNVEQETELTVELQKGLNELVICCEDLAERDTQYYFNIEYEGPEAIRIRVPLDLGTSAEDVKAVERALEDAYFPKDVVTSGDVKLMVANPLKERLSFNIIHGRSFDGNVRKVVMLGQGAAEINLGKVSGYEMGFTVLGFQTKVGSVNISKLAALQLFPQAYGEIQANTIEERKQLALSCIADHGGPSIHTAIAQLKTGRDVRAAKAMIRQGIRGINERRDCSDFYLIGLFKLWKEYRHTELFEPDFWEELKSCVLNFRYWIDEPGDDVMWFFSENHSLLFHACELLGGQLFSEETFTNSGESGLIHRQKGEERLAQWFERFFAEGLTEWNSSTYIPIDVVGLLHIYDLAESEKLRAMAKQAMDLLYGYIAINSHQGFVASTFGRSNEKEIKGHYIVGTTSLCWIGYGVGNVNSYATSNVILCLTDYAPPKTYESYLKVDVNEELIFKNEQGKDGYAKLYMYKRAGYAMSSIYNFRPGLPGYQEHVVEAFFTPEAQVWVNHPGERNCFGTGRPSFWAGNGYLPKVAQYKGLSILMYRIDPKHSVDFTHAYFPVAEFDRTEQAGGWHFAEKNGAYIAVYAQNGSELMQTGPDRGRELRSEGYDNVWLLRASDRWESGSFEQFMNDVCAMERKVFSPYEVSIADRKYGSLHMPWEGHLSVNGMEQTEHFGGVEGRIERITST
ncbi:hypothetical protein [Cohnella zeiphila]|uniref:Uncharacterized protein n=1 Tax=Cohnella zeiphila TaxID=2761120 RepID=A0A7X0VX71_9BACL|nr:hypothetical protein [Cohnella zeiphila]MBB6733270.1 hypothetical protein [Cohnella zeiphila]